jgi:hypothetical protein
MMAHLSEEEKIKGVITCSAGKSDPYIVSSADRQETTLKESHYQAKP